jgi:hypothetical protein
MLGRTVVRITIATALFLVSTFSPLGHAAETCEATIEIVVPATTSTGSDASKNGEISPSARYMLEALKAPWHLSEQWRLESTRTVSFPPPGEVRFVSLPSTYIDAVELRNLAGRRPDFLSLTHGRLQGAPTPCPLRYFQAFLDGPLAGRKGFQVVSIHPSGPIEARPERSDASTGSHGLKSSRPAK